MHGPSQFNTDRTDAGRWIITFSNPPINMFVPATIVELATLMADIESDPSVKVVVFQSANPDFFVAHLDVAKAVEHPEVLGVWRDFVLHLSSLQSSASPRFADARAASATSLHWPATCGSQAGREPCSAIRRSASDWSRAAERWNSCRA
jgi:enoyl-CoA hydratase/carnithine racemase